MTNYVIFGAGMYGTWLKRFLEQKLLPIEKDYRVLCFVDNFKQKGSYVEGIQVISPFDLQYLEEDFEVLISTSSIVDEAMLQLKKLNISAPVYLVPAYTYRFQYGDDMPCFVGMDVSKPRLPYMECSIVKHCNLKCKGCSAFANLNKEEFLDEKSFERDLKRLAELFCGIKYFKLFGGEPLLHPNLKKMIYLARYYFKDSTLVIHSNGLLVSGLSEELLEYISSMNVEFKFTLYPVTGAIKPQIENKLQRANIRYCFTEPIYNFRKGIRLAGDYNPQEIYSHCCKCINLIDGTLSCGMGYGIDRVEKESGQKICDDKWEGVVDIHATEMSGWEINTFLDRPLKVCAYCAFMDYSRVNHGSSYYHLWKGDYTEFHLEDYAISENDGIS